MLSTTIFFLEIWEGGRTLSQAIGKVPIMLIQFSTHSHHCINYRFCIHKIVSLLGYRIWQNLVYHLILASFYVKFFDNSGCIYFYWTSPIFKNGVG